MNKVNILVVGTSRDVKAMAKGLKSYDAIELSVENDLDTAQSAMQGARQPFDLVFFHNKLGDVSAVLDAMGRDRLAQVVVFYPTPDDAMTAVADKAGLLVFNPPEALDKYHLESFLREFHHTSAGTEFRRDAAGTAQIGLEDIRKAMAERQFVPHYQPEVDLKTGDVTGVEVLARWHHSMYGLVSPGRFLPVIEENDLENAMTDIVVQKALQDIAVWLGQNLVLRVGINLSAHALPDPRIAQRIARQAERLRLPSDLVAIEINDQALAKSDIISEQSIKVLREHGLTVIVDNVTGGDDVLRRLMQYACNGVKISRRQIAMLTDNQGDPAQAKKEISELVQVAHDQNMTVTAIGVESHEQQSILSELGCDRVQGYHLAQPMGMDRFMGWYRIRHQPS